MPSQTLSSSLAALAAPTPAALLLSAALLAVAAFVAVALRQRSRKNAGAPDWLHAGNVVVCDSATETQQDSLIAAHSRLGDLLWTRLSPTAKANVLVVRRPTHVKQVLFEFESGGGDKWGAVELEGVAPVLDSMNLVQPLFAGTFLHLPTGDLWKRRRRAVHGVLADPSMLLYTLEATAELAVELGPGPVALDVQERSHAILRDATSVSCFGPGRVLSREATAAFDALMVHFERRYSTPETAYEPLGPGDVLPVQAAYAALEAMLAQYGDDAPEKTTLAGAMRAAGVDDGEIVRTIYNLVVAGAESPAAAIAKTLARLAREPAELAAVLAELQEVVGPAGPVRLEHVSKLQRLDRVCREGLRLYPPATILSRGCTTPASLVAGPTVPVGTTVSVCVNAVHMDPRIWPNPEQFSSDRFLERPLPATWVPFGLGKRECAGKALSMRLHVAFIAGVLRNWDVTCAESVDIDAHLLRYVSWAPHGVEVVLSRR